MLAQKKRYEPQARKFLTGILESIYYHRKEDRTGWTYSQLPVSAYAYLWLAVLPMVIQCQHQQTNTIRRSHYNYYR